MSRTFVLMLALVISASYQSVSMAAQLTLNGAAMYTQLTKDYYLGGLYTEQRQHSATEVLGSARDKEMRLIIQTRWSPRNWRKLWQANISINNDRLPDSPSARKALMDFINLPQSNLQAGDEIRILSNVSGFHVRLNHETAIHHPDRTLFQYLLNTWLGKLPPSRAFKSQILGQPLAPELAQQLTANQVDTDRLKLFSGWIKQHQQTRLAATQAERAKTSKDVIATPPPQTTVTKVAAAAEAEQERQQALKKQQAIEKQKALKKRQAQQERLRRQSIAKAKSTQFAAQQQYFLALYEWQLQQALIKETRYPPWAKQFQQQGTIDGQMTLNTEGRIVALELHASTDEADLLLEEIKRVSKVISDTILPPEQLQGAPWTFPLHYQFELPEKAKTLPQPPAIPASLKVTKEQSQHTLELSEYRQLVRDTIIGALVYPKSAQVLKKQGQVTVSVTLTKQGTLDAIELTEESRHRELNRALEKAVKDAAPFPAIPGGQPQTLVIRYDFKI